VSDSLKSRERMFFNVEQAVEKYRASRRETGDAAQVQGA
jgi:hypothetical protein